MSLFGIGEESSNEMLRKRNENGNSNGNNGMGRRRVVQVSKEDWLQSLKEQVDSKKVGSSVVKSNDRNEDDSHGMSMGRRRVVQASKEDWLQSLKEQVESKKKDKLEKSQHAVDEKELDSHLGHLKSSISHNEESSQQEVEMRHAAAVKNPHSNNNKHSTSKSSILKSSPSFDEPSSSDEVDLGDEASALATRSYPSPHISTDDDHATSKGRNIKHHSNKSNKSNKSNNNDDDENDQELSKSSTSKTQSMSSTHLDKLPHLPHLKISQSQKDDDESSISSTHRSLQDEVDDDREERISHGSRATPRSKKQNQARGEKGMESSRKMPSKAKGNTKISNPKKPLDNNDQASEQALSQRRRRQSPSPQKDVIQNKLERSKSHDHSKMATIIKMCQEVKKENAILKNQIHKQNNVISGMQQGLPPIASSKATSNTKAATINRRKSVSNATNTNINTNININTTTTSSTTAPPTTKPPPSLKKGATNASSKAVQRGAPIGVTSSKASTKAKASTALPSCRSPSTPTGSTLEIPKHDVERPLQSQSIFISSQEAMQKYLPFKEENETVRTCSQRSNDVDKNSSRRLVNSDGSVDVLFSD